MRQNKQNWGWRGGGPGGLEAVSHGPASEMGQARFLGLSFWPQKGGRRVGKPRIQHRTGESEGWSGGLATPSHWSMVCTWRVGGLSK